MKRVDKRQWLVIILMFVLLCGLSIGLNKATSKLKELQTKQHEIAQVVIDEGYRACSYKDSLGYGTVGFGHLILKGEAFTKCISTQQAVALLRKDYDNAEKSASCKYPWASGDTKLMNDQSRTFA